MTYEEVLRRFDAAKERKRIAVEKMQQRFQDEAFCALVRQQKSAVQYGNA